MAVFYSDSYVELHIRNKLWTMIIETKNVKYFVRYDKGERLKMSRKVLKNWGCALSHFFQFETAPNSGKNS
jgi:hypothetical protein